jgi:hypothetical protein
MLHDEHKVDGIDGDRRTALVLLSHQLANIGFSLKWDYPIESSAAVLSGIPHILQLAAHGNC